MLPGPLNFDHQFHVDNCRHQPLIYETSTIYILGIGTLFVMNTYLYSRYIVQIFTLYIGGRLSIDASVELQMIFELFQYI